MDLQIAKIFCSFRRHHFSVDNRDLQSPLKFYYICIYRQIILNFGYIMCKNEYFFFNQEIFISHQMPYFFPSLCTLFFFFSNILNASYGSHMKIF